MSRRAFERTVELVMKDPLTQRRGVDTDGVRAEVRRAARVAELNPLKPAETKPDPEPQIVRATAPVDRDSRMHYDLDKAHGTAPPRVGMSQRAEPVTHDPVMDSARRMLERVK